MSKLSLMCILSACYNKQACSPPPRDSQSFAGYYLSAFRSWKGACISQRAGPANSAALDLLSSGQRRRQFSSVWLGPPGLSQTWGEGAIKNSSNNCSSEIFYFLCCYSLQVLNSTLGKQAVYKIKTMQVRACPPHRKSPKPSSPPIRAPRSLSESPVREPRKNMPSKRGDHSVSFCSCHKLKYRIQILLFIPDTGNSLLTKCATWKMCNKKRAKKHVAGLSEKWNYSH